MGTTTPCALDLGASRIVLHSATMSVLQGAKVIYIRDPFRAYLRLDVFAIYRRRTYCRSYIYLIGTINIW